MQRQQTQKLEPTVITSQSGFARETRKPIRTSSSPFVESWEMFSESSWKRNGRAGKCYKSSFKSSVLMCNLNDVLGNMEKCKLVPFWVHLH